MAAPTPPLTDGETLISTFTPNRGTYIREHIMLAALGAVLLSGFLIFMGNPHAWTGIVGSVIAITLRGTYAMKEQLGLHWHLTNKALIGPDGHRIALLDVDKARHIFSALQIITRSGDKYLIKYQPNPGEGAAQVLSTRDTRLSGSDPA